jgi:hypothetical protein
MSFLYRPTPVVNLGSGPFASTRVMSGWPGASMRGIPAGAGALGAGGPTGAVSRMRRVDTRMQPWLKTSGTMGSFLPYGLGQDDGSGIDWSTAGDISPDIPVFTPPDLTPPDLGSPSFSPNLPALISPSQPPMPTVTPIDTSMYSAPNALIPPSGAGPTGTGIPGTQPLNLQPSVPANALASAASSVANAVKNLFSPSTAVPAGYKQLPGYGGGVAPAQPSASVLPGVSNTLLLGAGVLLLGALALSGVRGKK